MRQNVDFPRALASWRKRHQLSQEALAERAGVGFRTITRLETSNSNPRLSTLLTLARVLRIDPGDLLYPAPVDDDESPTVRLDRLDVQASAGPGTAPTDYPAVVERVEVLEAWARRVLGSADPDRIKIIDVRGDSMAPRLNDGDIVFVDVSVPTVDTDGVYVFVRDGALHIKRLQRLGERLAIISDNTAYERDYIQASDAATVLHICGRVIGRWGFERAV